MTKYFTFTSSTAALKYFIISRECFQKHFGIIKGSEFKIYKTELRKMTSHFKSLTQKVL